MRRAVPQCPVRWRSREVLELSLRRGTSRSSRFYRERLSRRRSRRNAGKSLSLPLPPCPVSQRVLGIHATIALRSNVNDTSPKRKARHHAGCFYSRHDAWTKASPDFLQKDANKSPYGARTQLLYRERAHSHLYLQLLEQRRSSFADGIESVGCEPTIARAQNLSTCEAA